MSGFLILDTGPWVALLCRDDKHHAWAKAQFALQPGPTVLCYKGYTARMCRPEPVGTPNYPQHCALHLKYTMCIIQTHLITGVFDGISFS